MAGEDRIFREGGPRSGEPARPGEIVEELHHGGAAPVGEPVWLRASNGRVFEVHRGSAEHEHLAAAHQAVEIPPPATVEAAPAGAPEPPVREPGEIVRLRSLNSGEVRDVPYGSADWVHLTTMEQAVEVASDDGRGAA